jgi:hypothetical protein
MAAFKGHFSVVRVESVTRMPIQRKPVPHGIRLYIRYCLIASL